MRDRNNERGWGEFLRNTKEELKEKARDALDRALEAKTINPEVDAYFEVDLSDDGVYHIVYNGEKDFDYDCILSLFKFKTTDEDLEYYDKNFDFLFDNIWFQDIMFFLE